MKNEKKWKMLWRILSGVAGYSGAITRPAVQSGTNLWMYYQCCMGLCTVRVSVCFSHMTSPSGVCVCAYRFNHNSPVSSSMCYYWALLKQPFIPSTIFFSLLFLTAHQRSYRGRRAQWCFIVFPVAFPSSLSSLRLRAECMLLRGSFCPGFATGGSQWDNVM